MILGTFMETSVGFLRVSSDFIFFFVVVVVVLD